ncbi:MAG: hypothetical protein M3357_19740 [Actinomycetota bacterium]|nr:hypothetical protein [Actinomycetota bacterium]
MLNRTVVAPLSSAIIAVMLAGIVVVGVDRSGVSVQPGEARLEARGIVEVSVDGLSFVRADGSQILSHDDRVRVVDGTARLELPNSSMVELRAGSAVAISDGGDAALVLESGDLLVQAPRDTVEVDGGTALVSVVGAAKLRRDASLVAGVYDGNVMLVRDTNKFPIPRYRQAAAVGTGLLPHAPEPLSLSRNDEWDRRMLPEVLELDTQLNVLGQNFETTLPAGAEVTPEVLAAMVPEAAGAVTQPLVGGRAPAEKLIGLVLVALDKGDFKTRVERVFGFRSAGASWGLVAADRNLNPLPVIDQLESALEAVRSGGTGGELASDVTEQLRGLLGGIGAPDTGSGLGSGEEIAAASPAPAPGDGKGSAPSGSKPDGGSQPGGQPAPPSGTPPSTPPPSKRLDVPSTGTVLDPILDPLVDPLESLLSGVLDGVLGTQPVSEPAIPPPPGATTTATTPPAPASTAPPSDGLLGGLTSTVGGLLGG